MGMLEGKVAFITGAARGQGRSQALRMAEEGADIIAVDLCRQIDTVPYPMATPEDLAETVRQVKALDRRIVATETDIRDGAALKAAVDDGVAQLGRLDIASANAGIASYGPIDELSEQTWEDMLATNLTGAYKTVRAAIPHLKANENGGSIVMTGSTASIKGVMNAGHYTAAKHGLVGLMKVLALELAPHMIRVNCVHPTSVPTGMIINQGTYDLFRPDLPPGTATADDTREGFQSLQLLPITWVEPVDIANAVVWLCSDMARYVTGIELPVDAGSVIK